MYTQDELIDFGKGKRVEIYMYRHKYSYLCTYKINELILATEKSVDTIVLAYGHEHVYTWMSMAMVNEHVLARCHGTPIRI
jgi:hypothetical protein